MVIAYEFLTDEEIYELRNKASVIVKGKLPFLSGEPVRQVEDPGEVRDTVTKSAEDMEQSIIVYYDGNEIYNSNKSYYKPGAIRSAVKKVINKIKGGK